jgi:hypothetical protein
LYKDQLLDNFLDNLDYEFDPLTQVNTYYGCGHDLNDVLYITRHSESGALQWQKQMILSDPTWGAQCSGIRTVKPFGSEVYVMGTFGVSWSRGMFLM